MKVIENEDLRSDGVDQYLKSFMIATRYVVGRHTHKGEGVTQEGHYKSAVQDQVEG